MRLKLYFFILLSAVSCGRGSGWSEEERELVGGSPRVMRVLSAQEPGDLAVLRARSCDLSAGAMRDEVFKMLADKMLATVMDTSQDGVGIAAPQVGISRRVVAVQRLDKAGQPFEVYPNIRITAMRGEMVAGPEGCLSVPGCRGNVLRSRDIDIEYTSLFSMKDTAETVEGFTAVIFQHECDHLDGVLYTDRMAFSRERGVQQCAALWRESDGTKEEFEAFVKDNYASTPEAKELLFNKLSKSFEQMGGAYNQLALDLQKPTMLDGPQPMEIDYILSGYNPGAHFTDDMFDNKVAFITILNFPNFTLAEKNEFGKLWNRQEWAYARMGDIFTTRTPAKVLQESARVAAAAENYIASYNIRMDHLLTEDGERLFPEGMSLLSHWNLRDELKSDYAEGQRGLQKQEMIYKVMQRIVCQDIPRDVVNNPEYDWAPFSNRTYKNGQQVELLSEGAGDAGRNASGEGEQATSGGGRYQKILDIFHSMQELDKYNPVQPTGIIRNFEGGMEVSAEQIEELFVHLVSSPQVKQVAGLIRKNLGRELRPFDIWYDGFKSRSSVSEDALTSITRRLYPTPDAFKKDMPRMLAYLGFPADYAAFVTDKIEVESARGSGHAWGATGRGYHSFLRTRTGADGMDYKGYNIAVHEFGHNVEQTIDLYDIDYFTLAGVPNTAFTEALAFVFQVRDLQLLGDAVRRAGMSSDARSVALSAGCGGNAGLAGGMAGGLSAGGNAGLAGLDPNMTLDIFWGMYEIMGVSLVDMYVWRWLYGHPSATAEQLRDNTIRIAREVWNKYYEPVLGEHDSPILAIYSHMVNSPMYLPNYPFGHIIEFQLEEYFASLPDSRSLGSEIMRIYRLGRLTPSVWMNQAVGASVSTDPILRAVESIFRIYASDSRKYEN